jgi:hypothetical protein
MLFKPLLIAEKWGSNQYQYLTDFNPDIPPPEVPTPLAISGRARNDPFRTSCSDCEPIPSKYSGVGSR